MAPGIGLTRNPVSAAGVVLTTFSAVAFLAVFVSDLFGFHTNPYVSVVFFLILPALFLVGLALIPLGAWIDSRRRGSGKAPLGWPRIDLNDSTHRTAALIVVALTLANLVIVSLASYRGVEYMESVEFCGQVCHTPMKPELVAHEGEPHARVKCVACHVGPGASSAVSAKLAGTRRLLAVAFDSYPRPIVAAAGQLLPAGETCERCHWPEQFHGDKTRRIVEYGDDEKNTESATTLQLHVGGGDGRLGTATGIHWHMNIANEIEYIATDKERQVIPYVRAKDRQGVVREYFAEGVTAAQLTGSERRRMDCTDCHNRPSHSIDATPERAVNKAMARGALPGTLPFVRREAVKALKVDYPSEETATVEIARALRDFYRAQPAAPSHDVDRAVVAVQDVYRRNVFPAMKVTFGTYPNNIGHVDFPGCFRCHDDGHKAADGKTISQDCETCHSIE